MNDSSARRPVVGVVGYLLDAEAAERRQFGGRDLNVYALNYFRKALDVGMLPVGLPAVEPDAAPAYCDLVDGLVLTKSRTGPRPRVNSLHHQAVSRVAPGLAVAGQAEDGVIEAVVGEACPVLGVQWHPEQLAAGDPAGDGPFGWLRDRITR